MNNPVVEHYHLTMYFWIEGNGQSWTVHLVDSNMEETGKYETTEHIEVIRNKYGAWREITEKEALGIDS